MQIASRCRVKHLLVRALYAVVWTATGACARPARAPVPDAIVTGELPSTWYAGGPACSGVPRLRVHAYTQDFYILRQPACTNYEKPFLYLLIGDRRALLLDTGAGDQRPDLDQSVLIRHTDGGAINPCVKVLHRFLLNGSMAETINE